MVELVDTRDLKSLDRNIVPVQVRPRVPSRIKVMKHWLVATYKINEINRLQRNLSNQGFIYFLPKITKHKHNHKPKEELLFPGYVFVNTGLEDYSALKYTKGIKSIIKFGESISYISNDSIKSMQIAEESSKTNPLPVQLHIGQEATIKDGSLKGMMVKICSLPSNKRVDVLLTFLGSSRRVTIPQNNIVV